ncbi:tryptophan--tRNA ligase [Gemelliphila palaticanis]|uniref:Tryptophan--tRNA ligase n=1 Tax=Gemelliphila palaticanis TaxID=81950 RepID=A0ABX2SZF2_9BACL|nr:tryptophan--tRNA ligase [Gemella palaticanis]MBF0715533.1 tryptophan--tRNA ligase [Gemella palaticanis]NYS47463.1 tryptophan--tRNA ligase [Gemella palaticanis]
MKKVILTGDRPTGKLHLGHYVGSLQNRVMLQKENQDMYIMIADQQALTDNADNPKKIIESVTEVALDYLAVGIDPNKTNIFIQSQIPQLAELTAYYLNLVTVARLHRNPTVKQEIKDKNFNESIPAGFFTYPVSQAADITAFGATHVPVGEDQKPMIEQTREIVRDFNRIYNKEVLVLPEAVLPPQNQGRLVGIDGQGKMSKSLNNGIYLSDTPEIIKQKIMKMYTDPNHIRVEDPGKVEGNVVFTYLDIFDPNKEEVNLLKEQYQKGGLGDVKLKLRLNEIMQEMLEPIRLRREEFAKDKAEIYNILKQGSLKAEERAQKTLDDVKDAMGINYFK